MMTANATKFLLWSGVIVGVIALFKFKILTPKGGATSGGDEGDGEKTATEESGGVGGMGGGTGLSGTGATLSTLNTLANMPGSTSGPSSTGATLNLGTGTQTPTPTPLTPGAPEQLVKPKVTSEVGSINVQFGFNGKKSFGFRGEKNNRGLFI